MKNWTERTETKELETKPEKLETDDEDDNK